MSTPAAYDDLLARVRDLIATTDDRIPVVGISGHGGAGKSTLAARLGADLGLEEDQVVGTDAFYATTCGPDAGMWEQHDWALVGALVRGAATRPAPERLRFDYRWWGGETGIEDHPMPPVLVVEGIRLLSDRTRDWFDLAVWIDMDPGEAGARAKARNLLQGDDRAELDLWDTKWIPEGHAYEEVERPRERADLVISAER
jgi:uridine kinase